MISPGVTAPGRSGTALASAALATSRVRPGLTMKREPACAASSNCSADRMVPAPTTASSTSPEARRIASSAAGVRSVISTSRRPPLASARTSGTASSARSILSTGTTGWPSSKASNCFVFAVVEVMGSALQGPID